MKLLVDTSAAVFFSQKSSRLSKAAYEQLSHSESEVFVSAISSAELACLWASKKVVFADHWKLWFRRMLAINGWTCLPITLEIIEEAYSLPDLAHRDPADRILIATARLERMWLVTTDRIILNYPHVESIS